MSEERTKTSSICIVFLKVLVITIVVLSTVYFCVWTYQSIKRLEARDECFEGKLYSLGLIERPERLKGDHGDLVSSSSSSSSCYCCHSTIKLLFFNFSNPYY